MRDPLRLVPAGAQAVGQRGELLRRLLGDELAGDAGLELVGIGEGEPEQAALFRRHQIGDAELVAYAGRVGEVGVDDEALGVADDQQRRVLQRRGVLLELGIGGGEIGMGLLVFPAEAAALPHIRPAGLAGGLLCALLEAVAGALGVGLVGRRHVQQAAEVDEVRLGGLLLVQRRVPPLVPELFRSHAASIPIMAHLAAPPFRSKCGGDAPAWNSLRCTASETRIKIVIQRIFLLDEIAGF